MNKETLNAVLNEVIDEARELNIPVPHNISREIIINPRPRKRYGCCRRKGDKFTIEISSFILACQDKKIKGVIAHEVLHTCPGCYEHGSRWKEYAGRMNDKYGYNIKRTSSFEEMGLKEEAANQEDKIKYIIKCRKCGREYPRQRYTSVMRKINMYRCKCGGKLSVLKK